MQESKEYFRMEQKKLNDILAPALLKLSETDAEILESLHLQAQQYRKLKA